MTGFSEEALKNVQNSPTDEFGVSHDNILYNQKENKLFCILDAPNKEAIEMHHHKLGIKCDWITGVSMTSP
jgi:hypothetical protein